MSNFVERIKEMMKDEGLKQIELSRKTGITHSTLSGLVSGKHTPNYKSLIKIMMFFDCSADYLLGLDEIHTEEKLFVPQEFSTRLRAVLKEKGVSGEKLKRDLSLSGSVLFKWLSGKAQPSAHSLTALAKYFDCSIDYLIGRRK
ncbi:MAG: helix-turn-helix domain-containing protein [Clostridia bacterium]|nr:helix-turn-helix domain-containing protein [Clostridia bacterium]